MTLACCQHAWVGHRVTDGEVGGWHSDVDERLATMAATAVREQTLRKLLASDPRVTVTVLDADGHISFATTGSLLLFGREPGGVVGMHPSELVHDGDREAFAREVPSRCRVLLDDGTTTPVRLVVGSVEPPVIAWCPVD